MGVLDKIKNALFEVEYVEVEDKPKKEKKFKSKDNHEEEDKPIAKKIVLPGKKEEKVEEIQEVELIDADFEIRPKEESVKEVFNDNFNVMEDDDVVVPTTEPVVEEVTEPVVEEEVIETPVQHTIPDGAQISSPIQPVYQEPAYVNKDYVREYDSYKEKVYSTIHDDYRVKTRESRPYGMDPSYQISIKEYGTENRDDKGYFKPSPIISPIYGILDKNYKKEDVVSKREIHITSSYAKNNMNVDDIRNKAYGKHVGEEVVDETPIEKTIPNTFEVAPEDENLLVDLTDEKKPEVKEITVGDALEYYHDLGLEYNVDYVDATKKNPPQPKSEDLEEEIKDTIDNSPEVVEEPVIERTMEIPQEEIETPKEEVKEEKKEEVKEPVKEEVNEEKPVVEEKEETVTEEKEATIDDDDNLFDLIDSMYKDDED